MEPNTPQNLDELVAQHGIKTFTIDRVHSVGTKSTHDSGLVQFISDLIADSLITQKQETYRRIAAEVHLTFRTPIGVAWELFTSGFITSFQGNEVVVGKQDVFAVIDHEYNFKLFRHSLALFGKYKPAKPHPSMGFYTMWNFWFMDNNFFANVFVPGFISLVESGIYGRWFKNSYIAKPQLVTNVLFNEIRESISARGNDGDAEATTLLQVWVAFVLFLAMLLASLAAFVKELFRKREIVGILRDWLTTHFRRVCHSSTKNM